GGRSGGPGRGLQRRGAAVRRLGRGAGRATAADRGGAGKIAGPQRRTAGLLRRPGPRSRRPEHAVAEADHRRTATACRLARPGWGVSRMSDEIEFEGESTTTTWTAFGDLMSVLLGAFVLILAGVIGIQLQLSSKLDEAVSESRRRQTLERAL